MKILAGAEKADNGSVVVSSGQWIGYLPQDPKASYMNTIRELLISNQPWFSDHSSSDISLKDEIEQNG